MEIIKKYATKRSLGILLILCMLLPLLPLLPGQQAHAEIDITTKIIIFNMGGQPQELNATYPYFKNGERAKSGKLGKDGCTAYFNHKNGYLYLKDFKEQSIQCLENNQGTLSIRLEGENTITNKGTGERFGIANVNGGDITIVKNSETVTRPRLTIDVESSDGEATGISGSRAHNRKSDIFIADVDLTIDASYTGNRRITSYGVITTGIFQINNNTSFNTKVTGHATEGVRATGDININAGNSNDVLIESYGTYSATTLYSGSKIINLNSAKSLHLKWTNLNQGPNISYSEFAKGPEFTDNSGYKNVIYRQGTPRSLTLTDAYNENGKSSGEYLQGDTVEVIAKEAKTNYKFKEWTGTGLEDSGLDLTQSSMTFTMPAKDVELAATYEENVFLVQPTGNTHDAYAGEAISYSWETTDFTNRADYVKLQSKNDTEWEDTATLPVSYRLPGQYTETLKSSTPTSKTYRLLYRIFPNDFYSDEFTLKWLPAKATDIEVTPSSAELVKGNSIKFTASVTGLGNFNDEVRWVVLPDAQSPFTQITQEGLLVVSEDETADTIRVKGYVVGTQVAQTVTVTVKDPPAYVTGISISPTEVELSRGQSYQFNADLTGIGNFNHAVKWSIAGHVHQKIDEDTGSFSVNLNQEVGDIITVTATSVGDSSISASAKVKVVEEGKVTSLKISPRIATVEKGTTQEFTANITGTGDNFNKGVLWQVRDEVGRAVNSTISYNGVNCTLYVAENEIYTKLKLSATSQGDGTKSDHAIITVVGPPTISSVKVSPESANVQKGTTQQFIATVEGTNLFNPNVTWKVTGGVAGTTINESGVLTVAEGETATSLSLRATSIGNTSKEDTVKVNISDDFVTRYTAQIFGGSGSGEYQPGNTVAIAADPYYKDQKFLKWVVISGAVTFEDMYSHTTKFQMPNEPVRVQARYESPGVTWVKIGGQILDSENQYLYQDEWLAAKFVPNTGTLILNGYHGSGIEYNSNILADLNIVLEGTSTITETGSGPRTGILNNSHGNINITATGTTPTLNINLKSTDDNAYGIDTIFDGSSRGDINISGDVKLIIDVESQGHTASANGVNAADTIKISDSASLEVRAKGGRTVGAFARRSILFNTDKDITIESHGTSYANALSAWRTINLNKVQTMNLKSSGAVTNPSITYDASKFAVNHDTEDGYKSSQYRLGTPYNVNIIKGSGGGQYLKDDEITITANQAEKYFRFKEWQGTDGLTFVDGTSASTPEIKFKMPANDINLTATYEDIGFNLLVINGAGSGKYEAGDTVTVNAKDPKANFKFKEWEGIGDLDLLGGTSTSTEIKFTMPSKDVELTAIYKGTLFTVQPQGNTGYAGENISFDWELSDYEGGVYYVLLQIYEDGEWKNSRTLNDQYKETGAHTSSVWSDTAGSKKYRLHYYIGTTTYCSDEFTITWKEPVTSFTYGDVDGVAGISSNDASLVLQHVLGKITLEGNDLLAADVDGVEGISSNDASLILQKVLGKISKFPVEH